ncbi:hypothetical protein [Streptomyces sp. NPDC089799]|uniref:hypothetical protein n=1 Tax=Streptomyces sp. NPDC089799 TaxID=3155066 RepID=UPI003414F502
MRIPSRTAATLPVAAAATAAAALTVLLPAAGTSTAASGGVEYTYVDDWGRETTAVLVDPEDGACIALPELGATPAFRTANESSAPVLLYGDRGCSGQPLDKVVPGRDSEVRAYAVRLIPDDEE